MARGQTRRGEAERALTQAHQAVPVNHVYGPMSAEEKVLSRAEPAVQCRGLSESCKLVDAVTLYGIRSGADLLKARRALCIKPGEQERAG